MSSLTFPAWLGVAKQGQNAVESGPMIIAYANGCKPCDSLSSVCKGRPPPDANGDAELDRFLSTCGNDQCGGILEKVGNTNFKSTADKILRAAERGTNFSNCGPEGCIHPHFSASAFKKRRTAQGGFN
jgi:hypothetical protein